MSAHPEDAGASGEGRITDRWVRQRAVNNAFGEALAYAFEFVATALIFAGVGWLLDRWLGTRPVLFILLALLGFIGVCLRTIYHYKAKVERDEEGKPWTRRPR